MNNNQLYHFGILGMKWGVRRTDAQLARAKGNIDSTSNMVKEAKNITNNIGNIRTVAGSKKNDISSITDADLKKQVARLNLEQQYSTLTASKNVPRGESYAKATLEVAGSVLAIASSAAALALTMRQLKKG